MNFISKDLLAYCEQNSSAESEVLNAIYRKTHLTQINPRMLSGHLQGGFLKLLTQLVNPKPVLEIGTYTGYSAICMAMVLSEGSVLDTIEIDEELKEPILANFEQAGVSEKVNLHIGNALQIIPELLKTKEFDMVFIDADKSNYPAYFSIVKNGLRSGGLLIADNVLWSGKVLDSESLNKDPDTMAVHQFNKMLAADSQFETVVLPIRDGITVARKK
jgi:caffeoyl-CoA O-methyltransferase